MTTISLAVTRKTASYLANQPDNAGRQIAIRDASHEIRASLDKATKTRPVTIRLGKRIALTVGDTHAIWRSHNLNNVEEYDRLFDLLACQPDASMLFPCEIIP